ncbi:hypothetical protein PPL_12351 [Heterostelium album PN500]|uniref:V-type proton ATPase subunit S1/VOA1 transmembrane domain-containing protein n=1 Tax=Heterostelium pallidum (strain ATCC 26659 / Pp 5 / PN500) TaxID=670386 RepID=D3BLH4_HETP5|nr:hypothetical protein PPL_12351 [Heterostelium album PN500]EFA77739.1 hypothetical protein PPL_12351 [Heterostelium album PN500]|eukprot:XP_020429867.1 hypothetical protein PPL_12351 [Heterostelium album PN500]
MKVVATLFLIATVLFGITIASLNIPIIGWSSNKVFIKNEILESYSADQFKELLVSLIKGSESDVISASKPEIITIFVQQQLRTDELSTIFDSYNEKPQSDLQSMKDSIEGAASSIFIPYTTTSGSFVSSVLKSISNSIEGSLVVASDSEFTVEGDRAHHLETNPIHQEYDFQQENECVNAVNNVLKGVESVSFFTGENATPLEFPMQFQDFQEPVYHFSMFQDTPNASNTTDNSTGNGTSDYFNYFPGPIIEAYLVVFILLVIFFMGLCCILDLQVPDRYEAPKQKIL